MNKIEKICRDFSCKLGKLASNLKMNMSKIISSSQSYSSSSHGGSLSESSFQNCELVQFVQLKVSFNWTSSWTTGPSLLIILPFVTLHLTLPYILPYLTSYLTLPYILPFVTLPYVLPYLTLSLTLRFVLPYLTFCLTLPYLLPCHTLPYILPYPTSGVYNVRNR